MSTQTVAFNTHTITEFALTISGTVLQTLNVLWALHISIIKPKTLNFVMAASMVLYWISFFPLLRLTGLSAIDTTSVLEVAANRRESDLMRYIHNLLFSLSTLFYLYVMQTMVQLIKCFRPYPNAFDIVAAITTTSLWTILCFGGLVVVPIVLGKPPIIVAGVIWSLWVLLVDMFAVLVFFKQMLGPKLRLEKLGTVSVTRAQKRNRKIMFVSLAIIFLLTIALITFPALSGTVYADDEENRRWFYRLGFTLSPIWHFGHLLFLKTVEIVFQPTLNHANDKDDSRKEYATYTHKEPVDVNFV